MEEFSRIVQTPDVISGKARIRGNRISVAQIVGMVAAGWTFPQILEDFPSLVQEDIVQALFYASWLAERDKTVLAA